MGEIIPDDMIMPEWRRDLSHINNVGWALRNLQVRNGGHPLMQETLDALKAQHRILFRNREKSLWIS